MCVIVAKYFQDKGWIGIKNRDRNYVPRIGFDVFKNDDVERLMLHDRTTGYKEGINSNGVSILSASLMVQNDEKEVTKGSTDHSPDGKRISKALLAPDAFSALKQCVIDKLTGNTIIFDKDNLFLLEACNDIKGRYHYKIKKIDHGDTVARTNHGVWLPWAGYQRTRDENQTLSRISSEARMIQAEVIVKRAQDADEMLNGLCKIYIDHPQLNVMRTSTGRKKMRTTAQEMCIPSERTLYCRPINSHIEFNFWKLNRPSSKCWVEILSNRELWQNIIGHRPFASNNMKHFG